MNGNVEDYEYYTHVLINTQDLHNNSQDTKHTDKDPWLLELGLDSFSLDGYKNDWKNNIENIYGYNYDCL